MRGRERAIAKMVEAAGLEQVWMKLRGSGHYGVLARAKDGREQLFIFSNTPSDARGDLNKAALLRRFARGQAHTPAGLPSFICGAPA